MTNNYPASYLSPLLSNLKRSKKIKAFKEYKRIYNLYLADKNIVAFNFRILIAYEKWPNHHCIDSTGTIFKADNKDLNDALEKIHLEIQEYMNEHYPLLHLTF